jgi:Protein kinase domain
VERPVAAQHLFGLAHPEFYETLASYPLSPEYVERLKELLPDAWTLQRDDVWVHARRPVGEREMTAPVVQGFKIHVSSAPVHALRVLAIVVPVCVQQGIEFKIAGDPTLLHILNSKLQGRGYSGKFMTIYPPDEEAFSDLIERLYQQTKDEAVEGPYILSDRRYKDSKLLFYRYGGFRPPRRLNIDGTQTTFLVSPTGEPVADERLPYFRLPDWVRDPFGGTSVVEHEGDALLNDRYLVEGALGFSNAGGVYHGTDTQTGRPVIIKEARPFTNCWTVGNLVWDAVYLLKREYHVLRCLADLDFVPEAIDLFQDWEHTFLVEEWVSGVSYHDYWAREELILAPYIRRAGRVDQFIPKFKHVAAALIRMVTAVHARGVLLGDLSPRNILIDAETLHMWLIDFESAVQADDAAEVLSYATRWGTPGFLHPARAAREVLTPEDDMYAIGMILYSAVVPVNMLFSLNPKAETVFLDKFIELGVPVEVKAVIAHLLRGAVEAARDVLAHWSL